MKNNSIKLMSVLGLLFAGTLFSGCEIVISGLPTVCSGVGPCREVVIDDPPRIEDFVSVEARNLIEIEKNGEKRILLGINFDPGCKTLDSIQVSANRE